MRGRAYWAEVAVATGRAGTVEVVVNVAGVAAQRQAVVEDRAGHRADTGVNGQVGVLVFVGQHFLVDGAHGGDHAIYPDCRPEFVEKMDAVCRIAHYEPVGIEAPFMALDLSLIHI